MNPDIKLLGDAAFANQLNVIHHAYVDITGGLIEGALLGQILYWFGNGQDGQARARIERDGHLWIAKTRSDWWDEIRISPKQYDRAAKVLKDKGFIELKTMKFAGNPTTHIRINAGAINMALDEWKKEQVKSLLPKEEKPVIPGYSPYSNNEITKKVISESPKEENQNPPKENIEVAQNGISSYTENTADSTSIDYNTDHNNQAVAVAVANNDLDNHLETKRFIDESFELAWSAYPRKEGKQKAKQAFEQALRLGTATAEHIILQVKLYASYMEQRLIAGECEPKHIARGDNWFSGERWSDEYPTISSSFDDFDAGVDYIRTVAKARQTVRDIKQEKDQSIITQLRNSFLRLLTAL